MSLGRWISGGIDSQVGPFFLIPILPPSTCPHGFRFFCFCRSPERSAGLLAERVCLITLQRDFLDREEVCVLFIEAHAEFSSTAHCKPATWRYESEGNNNMSVDIHTHEET